MRYWLMKSEPDEASIDDLAAAGSFPWSGVRNYQARNFMRDAMQPGDLAFFYHSSCKTPGIAGICAISSAAEADQTQFDPQSPYFDPKATPAKPRWFCVSVRFVAKTPLLPISELRRHPELAALPLLQRGNRLSITPVAAAEWAFIEQLIGPLTGKDGSRG